MKHKNTQRVKMLLFTDAALMVLLRIRNIKKRLPKDGEILEAFYDAPRQGWFLKIQSNTFPEVKEGCTIPEMTPLALHEDIEDEKDYGDTSENIGGPN